LNVGGYSGDGGPATLALLNYPSGIAFDAQGNLYIADYYNCVIRKVSATTGVITTVVGNPHCPGGIRATVGPPRTRS
jgi:streptogramin lyase